MILNSYFKFVYGIVDKMDLVLFIKKIVLERDKIDSFNEYPFSVGAIRNLSEISFSKPVTCGVGKSTLIEVIAVSVGLNPGGGSQNFNFSTYNTHSILYNYIRTFRYNTPNTKYFLRAESFYNVVEISKISEESRQDFLYGVYGGNLHNCFYGESFIKLL